MSIKARGPAIYTGFAPKIDFLISFRCRIEIKCKALILERVNIYL